MKIVVIVDFDNVFPHKLQDYTQESINDVFRQILEKLLINREITTVVFKLYGGWFMGDNMTNRCSILMQIIYPIQQWFPMIVDENRVINGDVEIVMEIKDVPYRWTNTYKEHRGLPKLRIDLSKCGNLCESNKHNCPIKILQNYTKSKERECHIDGCLVKHGDVFIRREQKMVDTMIACDIISYTLDEPQPALAIISDDVDLFPALALRHHINQDLLTKLFIKNSENRDYYNNIVSNFNVSIEQIVLP